MANIRNDIRSRALDLLRFPLAIVIVLVHVFVGNGNKMGSFAWTDDSIVGIIINLITAFLCKQSVPIYFFISGFVFFLGFNLSMESYAKKMKNRFKSLFIPYILWNTLALILVFMPLVPFLRSFFPTISASNDIHLDLSLPTLLRMYWEIGHASILSVGDAVETAYIWQPIDGPLWFVRDLMIIAIATPLINILLKRFGGYIPLALSVLWFFTPVTCLIQHWITAFFFFTWGAYMSFNKKDMIAEFKKYRNISFIVYPLSALLTFICIYVFKNPENFITGGTLNLIGYSKNIVILTGLPFAYNLAVILIERYKVKLPSYLTSASFFIYAGHILISVYVLKIMERLIVPDSSIKVIIVFTLTTIAVVGILLGTYVGMKRVAPRLLKPFTGGRL